MESLRRSERRKSLDSSEITGTNDETFTWSTNSSMVVESVSTEWTDEKHSLYIKFMETSFVDHLYTSMDFRGRHTGKDKSDRMLLREPYSNTPPSSDQFKVFRGGCWQKINFEATKTQKHVQEDESHAHIESPWVQHFRPVCKTEVLASSDIVERELSDQNFVDNNVSSGKHSSKYNSKRIRSRTHSTNTSSSVQVVPSRDVQYGMIGGTSVLSKQQEEVLIRSKKGDREK